MEQSNHKNFYILKITQNRSLSSEQKYESNPDKKIIIFTIFFEVYHKTCYLIVNINVW